MSPALEVAGEHGAHGLARGGRALLGEEEAVGGVLERGRALEPLDAVVRKRAAEVHDVAVGQALGLGVERAQERVQVLLRAAEVVLVVEAVGVRAGERADVGVELQQAALGGRGRPARPSSTRLTSSGV